MKIKRKLSLFLATVAMLPGTALADIAPPYPCRDAMGKMIAGCNKNTQEATNIFLIAISILAILGLDYMANTIVLSITFFLIKRKTLIQKKLFIYLILVTIVGAAADILAIVICSISNIPITFFSFLSLSFVLIFIFNYVISSIFYKELTRKEKIISATILGIFTNPAWLGLLFSGSGYF